MMLKEHADSFGQSTPASSRTVFDKLNRFVVYLMPILLFTCGTTSFAYSSVDFCTSS